MSSAGFCATASGDILIAKYKITEHKMIEGDIRF